MMEKGTLNQKLSGQILVIILLMLSILSILVIAVVTTTTKDIQEQTQNKIYEQYNALNEQKLLQLQSVVGTAPLASITLGTLPGVCAPSANGFTCTINNQVVDAANNSKADTIIAVDDVQNISNYTLQKDKTLMLDLRSEAAVSIIFGLNPATPTSWIFSVDFISGVDYGTFKSVLTTSTIGFDSNITGPCFNSANTTSFAFTIPRTTTTAPCRLPAGSSLLDLRIRSLGTATGGDVNVSISGSSQKQFRTVTSVTTAVAGTGPNTSPSSILQVQYPLFSAPLEILDYVLRSEDVNGVAK
jgi:hypothetical protein